MGGQSHLFGLICQLLDVNEALLTIECFYATALSILFCLFLNNSFPVCGGPLICYKLAYFLSSNCIPTP